MAQNQALAAATITEMRHLVGTRERTGRNDGPVVEQIQHFVGLHRGDPYCAATAIYAIYHAAAKLGIHSRYSKTGSSSNLWDQARHKGLVLAHPVPGCLALVKGGHHEGKSHHHTAVVVAVHQAGKHSFVSTIDGNFGNRICTTSHPISACDFVAVA